MRILALVLGVLLVAIQYPLWFGKGGWLRVSELEHQLAAQRATNAVLAARNADAAAEVASLREGNEAIAERARLQLNMVREGEVLFQFVGTRSDPTVGSAPVR
jgi:cell division protein FtsB